MAIVKEYYDLEIKMIRNRRSSYRELFKRYKDFADLQVGDLSETYDLLLEELIKEKENNGEW